MKKLVGIILVILLVIGGVALVKKRREADKKIPPAKIYPLVVKMKDAKNGHIVLTTKYLAIVKSNKNVLINSKFAGKIDYIAPLGSKVKKGDVVVKIDATPFEEKLKSINANIKALKKALINQKTILANFEDSLNRTQKLYKADLASIEEIKMWKNKILAQKIQIDSTKAKLKTLKANKKEIEDNLKYLVIHSPVDGVVSAKMLNVGDNAFPGKPIIKIASNSNYLFIPLAKNYKEIIYKNRRYPLVNLHTTFNGLKVFKADVNDSNLVEGEKVDIKVVTFDGKATLVPYNAVLSVNNENFVFTPESKKVTILATGEEGVAIKENVKKVVVSSPDILLKIKAGYPVKVKE